MKMTDAQYARILRQQGKPAKPRTTLPAPSEADEQAAVIEWAHAMVGRWPELALLAHIPNGEKRDAETGARLKAQGVSAGIPDLILACQRRGADGHHFGALFIEMKTPVGRVRPEQEQWLERLRQGGYMAVVCRSAEEAIRAIEYYLTMDRT